jgi:hypothetical protein
MEHPRLDTLFQFPCDFEFKAFGTNDGIFAEAVRVAIDMIVPAPLDAVRVRPSAHGSYVCVSVVVRLHDFQQVEAAYAALRQVEGLKFLL